MKPLCTSWGAAAYSDRQDGKNDPHDSPVPSPERGGTQDARHSCHGTFLGRSDWPVDVEFTKGGGPDQAPEAP